MQIQGSRQIGTARLRHPFVLDLKDSKFVNTFDGWYKNDSSYLDLKNFNDIQILNNLANELPMTTSLHNKHKVCGNHYEWVSFYKQLQTVDTHLLKQIEIDLIEYMDRFDVIDEWTELFMIQVCLVLHCLKKTEYSPMNYSFLFSVLSLNKKVVLDEIVPLVHLSLKKEKQQIITMQTMVQRLNYLWRFGNYYLQCRGGLPMYNPVEDVFLDMFWLTSVDEGLGTFSSLTWYLSHAKFIDINRQEQILAIASDDINSRVKIKQIFEHFAPQQQTQQKQQQEHKQSQVSQLKVYCDS